VHLALLISTRFFIHRNFTWLSSFFTEKYYVLMSDFLIGILVCGFILAAGQALAFYRQIREAELKAAHLETQLALAQLQALKMQLHPHFIFNALHSISSHLRDTETARLMIARLGDFLRLTLANVGAQEVSLKQELEFLRCYLDIEQTRFPDRLTIDMEIDPETWDALLPNLILQPIVENAIKHGIAPQRSPGRISVRAQRLNGSLRVEIEDNGCGLPKAQTSAAPVVAEEGASPNIRGRFNEGVGIGLATTRSRLERFYPDAHLLQLRDAQKGGLVVILEVPFKTEGNGQGE
jgi:LytS/YehU family sensor histidine kinase